MTSNDFFTHIAVMLSDAFQPYWLISRLQQSLAPQNIPIACRPAKQTNLEVT